MSLKNAEFVGIENVNHPGQVKRADRAMYEAMKRAWLDVLPSVEPGLTFDEGFERLVSHLPETLFPGGAKAGWWAKAVQLDLEAKGVIVRTTSRPLRLRKVTPEYR